MTDAGGVTAELRALYERWFEAVIERDVEHLSAQMDDRWVYTDSAGAVHTKTDYLRAIAGASTDFELEFVSFRVLPVDPVAVVRAVWLTRAVRLAPQATLVSTTNHTGVWHRAESRWQSLVHHVTTTTDGALRSGQSLG
jgi:hypothetical protein